MKAVAQLEHRMGATPAVDEITRWISEPLHPDADSCVGSRFFGTRPLEDRQKLDEPLAAANTSTPVTVDGLFS